jgi:TPR repeat protein
MTSRIEVARFDSENAFMHARTEFGKAQVNMITDVDITTGSLVIRPPTIWERVLMIGTSGLYTPAATQVFGRIILLNSDHITPTMARNLVSHNAGVLNTIQAVCVQNALKSVRECMAGTRKAQLDLFKSPRKDPSSGIQVQLTTSDGFIIEASWHHLKSVAYFACRADFVSKCHSSTATIDIPISMKALQAFLEYQTGGDVKLLRLRDLFELMTFANYIYEENLMKYLFFTLLYRVDESNFDSVVPELIQLVATMLPFEGTLLPLAENLLMKLEVWENLITAGHIQPLFHSNKPWAWCILGYLYQKGICVKKDETQATAYFQRAAAKGLPTAFTLLGNHAVAAEQKSPLGLVNLGRSLEKTESTLAFTRYMLAANLGFHLAHQSLGDCYSNGIGCHKDLACAKEHYIVAACNGFPLAQIALTNFSHERFEKLGWAIRSNDKESLALVYVRGEIVPKSLDEAIKVFVSSPEHIEDLEKMRALHQFCLRKYNYLRGEKVAAKKIFYFFKSMSKHHKIGHFYMAWCYEHGFGAERDLSHAIKLYENSGSLSNVTRVIQQQVHEESEKRAVATEASLERMRTAREYRILNMH